MKLKPPNEEMVSVQAVIPKLDLEALTRLAVADDRSVSAWIRAAVREKLERERKGAK